MTKTTKTTDSDRSQLNKFKEAARELQTDDDPERFADRLRTVARHKGKPVPKQGEP